jgi:hypothetical protein
MSEEAARWQTRRKGRRKARAWSQQRGLWRSRGRRGPAGRALCGARPQFPARAAASITLQKPDGKTQFSASRTFGPRRTWTKPREGRRAGYMLEFDQKPEAPALGSGAGAGKLNWTAPLVGRRGPAAPGALSQRARPEEPLGRGAGPFSQTSCRPPGLSCTPGPAWPPAPPGTRVLSPRRSP